MVGIANRLCLTVALAIAGAATAWGQSAPPKCGAERWPVKILSDQDRSRLRFSPIEITIVKLTAIPIHEIRYPKDRRISPEEFTVYKIRGTLIEVRPEQDSDIHLIVADLASPEITMIAEIPSPVCAAGTGHENEYRKARETLASIPKGSKVEITGIGFFDYIHNARGTAKNGIELHPVLKIAIFKP